MCIYLVFLILIKELYGLTQDEKANAKENSYV